MKRSKKRASVDRGAVREILRFIKPHGFKVALTLALAALSVALTLYIPILTGRAVDAIVDKGSVDFEAIADIALTITASVAATAAAQWVMSCLNNRITYSVVRDVRVRTFRKLMKLPLSYLDVHPSGDIISRMVADVDQFSEGLLMGFTQLFSGVLTVAGTLAFMLTINPLIALIVVLLTPLSLFTASFVTKRTYAMFGRQSETRGRLTGLTEEMLTNMRVVKAFGYEDAARGRFDAINEELKGHSFKATFFSSLTNPSTRFVNSLVYAVVATAGSFAAVGGLLSVGRLTSFLSYANQYAKPFNEISGVVTELQNAVASASRVFALMNSEGESPDADGAAQLGDIEGRVEIKDVSFSYRPERPLIKSLSLSVKPGMRVAIVGPTGCGKTTFINLLMRFYDVNRGEISVEGHDIREVTRRSLRRSYGMVLQDTWLRAGTVRDNIRYGRPDASDEEVRAAARSAHADGFISRMPQGYDTEISEDSLSHGQKQLLCIARVMLCLPPMLILDEATSSIDTVTERRVQQAFAEMMKGRTSFVVAHRLSTIKDADVILVMRDGDIVEKGSHDELIKKGGFYSELYNSQFAVN